MSELSKYVDELLRDALPADGPGAAILVSRGDEVLYRAGHGMAHIELGVPVEPHHVFRIGSITKQFTAVAILMLEEAGELDLGATLDTFLPDYPDGSVITVEHLLTHTSGIANYTAIESFAPRWPLDLTLDELIGVFRDEPMTNAPGEAFNYSNSGYALLGFIIEQLSGMRYARFVRERIFEPLGMGASGYDLAHKIMPGRVSGYDVTPAGVRNTAYLSMTVPHAAGALASNVDDLLTWNRALWANALISQETFRRATTRFRLNDGSEAPYGYGWRPGDHQGTRLVEHAGGINGFVCQGMRAEAEEVLVVMLCNSQAADPAELAFKILCEVLDKPYDVPGRAEGSGADWAGRYEAAPFVIEVTGAGDDLMIDLFRAVARFYPTGDDEYAAAGAEFNRVSFRHSDRGATLRYAARGSVPLTLVQVAC